MKAIRLFCLSIAMASCAVAAQAAGPRPYDKMIVFGHSAVDNGNDFLLSGGIAAAPPYWGRRFSNGPLWVEWLANRLGFPPPKETKYYPYPAEAGGTCYGYGGVDTGPGFSDACIGVGPNKVCAPNVGLQIERFLATGTLDGDELIVLHAGDNDHSAEIAARNMGEHLAVLAAAGGKTFLVPSLDRLSQYPGPSSAGSARDEFLTIFNAELARQLDAVEAQYHVTIFRLDLLSLTDSIIASPGAFGLTNVTDPACPDCNAGVPPPGAADTVVPNPDQYMFWDGYHLTRVVQKIIGDQAADLVLGKQ